MKTQTSSLVILVLLQLLALIHSFSVPIKRHTVIIADPSSSCLYKKKYDHIDESATTDEDVETVNRNTFNRRSAIEYSSKALASMLLATSTTQMANAITLGDEGTSVDIPSPPKTIIMTGN